MSRRPHRPRAVAGRDRPTGRRPESRAPLILFGRHPLSAALANPRRTVHRLMATEAAAPALADLCAAANRALPAIEMLAKADLDALLPAGAVHQGMAAQVAPLPAPSLASVLARPDRPVVVFLDQVTDPHNVGAILRSAAAFEAGAVVVPDRHAPDETGTLAKAACGALETVPLVRINNLARALADAKAAGYWVAGLDGSAPITLAAAGLTGPIGLVLGAEGSGLRRLTREACDHLVRLPMASAMESLNVSNAAAVALYELYRGRLAAAGQGA